MFASMFCISSSLCGPASLHGISCLASLGKRSHSLSTMRAHSRGVCPMNSARGIPNSTRANAMSFSSSSRSIGLLGHRLHECVDHLVGDGAHVEQVDTLVDFFEREAR